MNRRAAAPKVRVARPDDNWIREERIQVNGRWVEQGTELSIKGERGRFRFQHRVTTPSGSVWLNVIGGVKGATMFRAFAQDRVRVVHWKNKLRQSNDPMVG